MPMSPCLPALGAFLNILAFVDLFVSNVSTTVSLWFVSGESHIIIIIDVTAFACFSQTQRPSPARSKTNSLLVHRLPPIRPLRGTPLDGNERIGMQYRHPEPAG